MTFIAIDTIASDADGLINCAADNTQQRQQHNKHRRREERKEEGGHSPTTTAAAYSSSTSARKENMLVSTSLDEAECRAIALALALKAFSIVFTLPCLEEL